MGSIYKSARSTVAIVLIAAMILGFGYELYDIQIKNHEVYAAQNNAVKTYTVPLEAARGEIVDRNGNPLVTNRQGNSIVLDAAYFPSAKDNDRRNEVVLNLIKLFNKNKEEAVHNLPLKVNKKGKIVFFTKADDDKYKQSIKTMKSKDMLNVQEYASAQNCFDVMIEKYGLEEYLAKNGVKAALKSATYAMSLQGCCFRFQIRSRLPTMSATKRLRKLKKTRKSMPAPTLR